MRTCSETFHNIVITYKFLVYTHIIKIDILKDCEVLILSYDESKLITLGQLKDALMDVKNILLENRILFSQQNISIASNRWSSSGNSTYPYKAVVDVPGVTSSFYPIVQFSDTDSSTYDFSPSATSGDGTVTVMCKTSPSSAITIAQIVCYRGQLVTAS